MLTSLRCCKSSLFLVQVEKDFARLGAARCSSKLTGEAWMKGAICT
jgi:hypothetical protein